MDTKYQKNRIYLPFILTVSITIILFINSDLPSKFDSSSCPISQSKAPKLILSWTPYFSESLVNKWSAQVQICPDLMKKCIFTNDRGFINQADAVVFHYRDLNWSVMPQNRLSYQYYVFFIMESPDHTGKLSELASNGSNYFNWTMTYRQDSDVIFAYGAVEPMFEPENRFSIDQEILTTISGKNLPIAWFVSHCKTASKREIYAEALQTKIQVDTYGKCGNLKCQDNATFSCDQMLKTNYYFYLAFENSICKDYVTEKLFDRALNNFVVPIVLSDQIIRPIAPANSYIAADRFESPAELVVYLRYLMTNQTAYLEYFNWRRTKRICQSTGLCNLCRKLLNERGPKRVHSDLSNWWVNDAQCKTNFSTSLV